LSVRASDSERDEAVIQLKEEFVAGRLSHDTFLHRVNSALSARRRHELEPLLADLPEPEPRPSLLDKARGLASDVMRAAARTVRITGAGNPAPLYFPPVGEQTVFTIGREENCDLLVGDMTVSRIHARLTRTAGQWMLADLGSTNGTRVNGWRIRGPVQVRAGDTVRFGGAAFVIVHGVMQDVL
jgi:hypothetical protein